MNVFFSLKGSKRFIVMILKYANLQNIFCCSFHSLNEYKHGRTFLLKGNFYSDQFRKVIICYGYNLNGM